MYSMVRTRESLVEATKRLLAERGYVSTSPRAILQRSGAGQGSLYHYFRGKSDLAAAALREISAEMRAAVDEYLDAAGPIDAVLAWLTAPRNGLDGCRLGRLVAEPILDDPAIAGPVAAYFAHARNRLQGRLTEAQAAGELRHDIDPADLAAALVAAVQGGYVLARASGDDEDMRRAQRGAAALLKASITGAAQTPDH